MKKRILSLILAVCLIFSLSACFPSGGNKNNGTSRYEMISIDKLDLQAKHIDEKISESFSINADVKIEVKNNFNTYTAKSFDFDLDHYSRIFAGNEKPVDTFKDDISEMKYYDNFSIGKGSYRQNSFDLSTDEFHDRKMLFSVYYHYLDKNPSMDYDYYNPPQKELDFMSRADAQALVEEKMKAMNLEVDSYTVYSVDYEFLKLYDAWWEEAFMSPGEKYTPQTKDDEFYIVVPRFVVPNGSMLTNIYYDMVGNVSVDSGMVSAIVGKNGILLFRCDGLFDITDEKINKEIVSLDSALDIIRESYQDVSLPYPITVDRIELSYMPFLISKEQEVPGVFEIKPTWVFRLAKEDNRLLFLLDATTGEPVPLNETM